MALSTDAVLFAAFLVTVVACYHWSKANTESPLAMHGARDTKFQKRQHEALQEALAPPPEEEEEECKT